MAIDTSYTVTALTGKSGAPGTSATEVYFSFNNIFLSCDEDKRLKNAYSKTLSVITYTGTTKVASTISVTSNTSNIVVGTITNGTATTNGSIGLSLAKETIVTDGVITVSIVANGVNITKEIVVGSASDGVKGDRGEPANTIAFRANKSTFTTVNDGEVYTCGFDANGAEADVAGYVIVNGTKYYAKGQTNTNCACNGYLVIPTTSTDKSSPSVPVLAYDSCNGTTDSWYYIKNASTADDRTANILNADKGNWVVIAKMYQFASEGKCTVEPMSPCYLSSVNQEIEYHFGGLVTTVTQYTNANITPYKITQSGGTFSASAGTAINAKRGAIVLNMNAATPTTTTAELKIQFYNGTYWNNISSTDTRYPIAIAMVAGYLPAVAGYYNTLGLPIPSICGTYIETLTSNQAFINDLFANVISVGNIIKSNNYVYGASGFKLSSDGKAEINELKINDMTLSYDSKNNLVLGNEVLGETETTGTYNLGIGYQSLYADTTGSNNVGIGYKALRYNTTGSNNLSAGNYALGNNKTGNYNIALGWYALFRPESSRNNIAIGDSAYYGGWIAEGETFGNYNIGIGASSLYQNTTGEKNIAIGYWALYNNTTGHDNVAIGHLSGNTGGDYCVSIGTGAGDNKKGQNVSVGVNALGRFAHIELYDMEYTGASGNVAIGWFANGNLNNGGQNIAIGHNAASGYMQGWNNIAIGENALTCRALNNSIMNNNIAIGTTAYYGGTLAEGETFGNYNICIGNQSLYSNTTGRNNLVIGYEAGRYITKGSYNTTLGYRSGYNITTGSNNICIGYTGSNVNTSAPEASNEINIGNKIFVQNNKLYFGTSWTDKTEVVTDASNFATKDEIPDISGKQDKSTSTMKKFFGTNSGTTKYIKIEYTSDTYGNILYESGYGCSCIIPITGNATITGRGYKYGISGWYRSSDSKTYWLKVAGYRKYSISILGFNQSDTTVTISDATATAPTGITFNETFETVLTSGSDITLSKSSRVVQNQDSTSNYTSVIKWAKGGTVPDNYGPEIGQHNTGGVDSVGSIAIVPYNTTGKPWEGNVGLYIQKGKVSIDGTELSKVGHTHSYLPLSGGNMTGNISYAGSKATNSMIRFLDNAADAYGNGISIGGGGVTIIGSGEAATNIQSSYSAGTEKVVIASDEDIVFYTNMQSGVSSAKQTTINTSGEFNGIACNIPTASGKGNIWIA